MFFLGLNSKADKKDGSYAFRGRENEMCAGCVLFFNFRCSKLENVGIVALCFYV